MENMLNERDSLTTLLIQEKDIVKVYGTFLTETTNPELRKLLEKNFVEASKDQYKVFESMVAKKYYMPQPADEQEIRTQQKAFESVKNSLKS